MKEALRIIFFGTPEFAVDSLDILVRNGYQVVAVVTVPDQPSGRGLTLHPSPVKQYAINKGLHVLQPEKLKEQGFIAELSAWNADLFIVVAFRMLPEVIWKMPPLGTFNLHASLLPHYRGAAPINHVILNGENETGLTTFFLRHEIDTGDIILQEKIPIANDETAGELHDRMKVAGASLVMKTLEAIREGTVKPTGQDRLIDPSKPLKTAPKIFREQCRINWSGNTDTIFNRIRGLSPYPAAHTVLISPRGQEYLIKLYRAERMGKSADIPPSTLQTDGKTFLKITSDNGALGILELQLAGKKVMKTEEFLRGFRINSDWKVG